MSNISVIGTGYVGLVSGACFSEFGHHVICLDIDEKKIENLKNGILPIYEPGLEKIVNHNYEGGRLEFTTDYQYAVQQSEIIFIAVGTPPRQDGSADLQYVLAAAEEIAGYMDAYKIIVDKSTVPVGTGRKVRETVAATLKKRGLSLDFDIVSNPEFLREGSAVGDFMHPDRIVIGTESDKAKEMMKKVYSVLYLNNHPFVFSNLETAELIKYASNAFLATKITFVNEVANLCEVLGADVKQVAAGMGQDKRIGRFFLHAGAGYGGSCFPKDTRALASIGKEYGVTMNLVETTIDVNNRQKLRMVDKIVSAMKDVEGKSIAVLGLSFKPETDDVREAPAVTIIQELVKRGAQIKAYDPIAMENAKMYALENIDVCYCKNEMEAVEGADAIVLVTEWNQFRSLNLKEMRAKMRGEFFFDFRNVYERRYVEDSGLQYCGVGR